MTLTITRGAVRVRLAATLTNSAALAETLGSPALPDNVSAWLGRLLLLQGVPYSYLVPDETMLPSESIRFFELDANWMAALVDGAFSIGRNLANDAPAPTPTPSMALDAALATTSHAQARVGAAAVRAAALGVSAPPAPAQVSGLLLRSRVVSAYRGLGINAYGGPGHDQPLDLLRVERLSNDVLIALVSGAATRVDIHEAPEHLHFGIDAYVAGSGGAVSAYKNVHPFVRGTPVKIDPDKTNRVDFAPLFRSKAARTLRIAAVATQIGANNSAEMGFVMTQGVGLVSFVEASA